MITLSACSGLAKPNTPTSQAPPAGKEDGRIVARGPCASLGGQASYDAAVREYFEEDILKAGLQGELEARPLTTIYTPALREGYETAVAAGRCERVTYLSDGLRVTGFVLHPGTSGPHPVMIWLRGGNREFGALTPVSLVTLLGFADAGFVVVATQYRGVDNGEGQDEFGGADVRDVLALVPLAASLSDADLDRLFLLGGSRGGMQGILALRHGLRVKAAAFRAPMTDMWETLAARPELETNVWSKVIPDYYANKQQIMDERSAIKHVDEEKTPILLLQGRQDWRISLSSVEAYGAALAAAGREHKLVIYEREEHQLVFHRDEWMAEVVRWFKAHGAF